MASSTSPWFSPTGDSTPTASGSVCGSNLISTYDDDPAKVGVPLGGLDQAPSNAPEGHFFVGSKAPWFTITDGLPQHDTWPGSHAKVRETRNDPESTQ